MHYFKEKLTLNLIHNLKQPPTYYCWTGTNEGIIRATMRPFKVSITYSLELQTKINHYKSR